MIHLIRGLLFELNLAKSSLFKVPGFALTVVTTLAITLGALICVFNLNHLLMFKSLPFPDAEKLFVLQQSYTEKGNVYQGAQSAPGMIFWYKNQNVFSELALVKDSSLLLVNHPDQPKSVTAFVTPEYFSLLGPQMYLGRALGPQEAFDTHQPVAVLSYHTWQRWFNSDPAIIGKTAELGDNTFAIIGVTAKSFHAPANRNHQAIDMWVPWDYQDLDVTRWGVMTRGLIGIGKLKAEISQAQATQELGNGFHDQYIASGAGQTGDKAGAFVQPLSLYINGDGQNIALLLLAGAIGLILIAATNVTNLFLSRAAEKQRTMAIQAALGAKPGHLFVSMFAESFILCFVAGCLGMLVAGWGFVLLEELASQQLPRISELGLDGPTLVFSGLMILLLAMVFAKLSSRVVDYQQLQTMLQSSGKGTGLQISKRIRHLLIGTQITLVTLLVLGTSHVIDEAVSVITHPLGFNDTDVAYLSVDRPKRFKNGSGGSFDENLIQQNLLTLEIKEKLSQLPEVEQVSRSVAPAIFQGAFSMQLNDADNNRIRSFNANMVDHSYFEALGLPLVEGRTFTPQKDPRYSIDEIILSESLARELAPNGDAIGKIFQIQPTQPLKVIGIVKDYYRPGSNSEHSYKQYYLPYAAFRDIGFEIKLKAGARLERSAILPLLYSVDSSLKIQLLTDYTTQHAKLIYKHRLTAGLTISLAILALLLAGAGIYGILNYSTQMRRSELGIHLALGAKTHRVQNMVLKENLKPISLGFLSSLVIAMGIYLVIRQNFEFTLTPDFGMVAITIPIIVAMSFIACYLPVKAIINNDPIKALRNE